MSRSSLVARQGTFGDADRDQHFRASGGTLSFVFQSHPQAQLVLGAGLTLMALIAFLSIKEWVPAVLSFGGVLIFVNGLWRFRRQHRS